MSIENIKNIIDTISAQSGLQGKELEKYRADLAKLNEQELRLELSKTIAGNKEKDWTTGLQLERRNSIVMLENYDKENYTDEHGNEVTEFWDGETLFERVVKSTDKKGNVHETTITYRNGKPLTQTKTINGKQKETTTFKYNEPTEQVPMAYITLETEKSDKTKVIQNVAYIFEDGNYNKDAVINRQTITPDGTKISLQLNSVDIKNPKGKSHYKGNCIVEEKLSPNGKVVSTVYKGEKINDFDNGKLKRLYQYVEDKGEQYQVYYDGKGHTITNANAGDSIRSLATRYGTTEKNIRILNPKIKILQAGQTVLVPGEHNANSGALKRTQNPRLAKALGNNAELQKQAKAQAKKAYEESFNKTIPLSGTHQIGTRPFTIGKAKTVTIKDFVTKTLGLDINSGTGKQVADRLAQLPQEYLNRISYVDFESQQIGGRFAPKTNDYSKSNFNQIADALMLKAGVNIRTQEESTDKYWREKPQNEKKEAQKFAANTLALIYRNASYIMGQILDDKLNAMKHLSFGPYLTEILSTGGDGLSFGIFGRSNLGLQYDYARMADKFEQLAKRPTDNFERDFKKLTGIEYNQANIKKLMTVMEKTGGDLDSEEFKKACQKAFGFRGLENAQKRANDKAMQWTGQGIDIAIELLLLKGVGSLYKGAARTTTQFLLKQGTKSTIAQIGGGAVASALTMGTIDGGKSAITNLTSDEKDALSLKTWANTAKEAVHGLEFGAVAAIWGGTAVRGAMNVTGKVLPKVTKYIPGLSSTKELTKTVTKVTSAGNATGKDLLMAMYKEPGIAIKGVGFATEVAGFTGYQICDEVRSQLIKNGVNTDAIRNILIEKAELEQDTKRIEELKQMDWYELAGELVWTDTKEQVVGLGSMKGIERLMGWIVGAKSPLMTAHETVLNTCENLKGMKIEKSTTPEGKIGYKVTTKNGEVKFFDSENSLIAECQATMQTDLISNTIEAKLNALITPKEETSVESSKNIQEASKVTANSEIEINKIIDKYKNNPVFNDKKLSDLAEILKYSTPEVAKAQSELLDFALENNMEINKDLYNVISHAGMVNQNNTDVLKVKINFAKELLSDKNLKYSEIWELLDSMTLEYPQLAQTQQEVILNLLHNRKMGIGQINNIMILFESRFDAKTRAIGLNNTLDYLRDNNFKFSSIESSENNPLYGTYIIKAYKDGKIHKITFTNEGKFVKSEETKELADTKFNSVKTAEDKTVNVLSKNIDKILKQLVKEVKDKNGNIIYKEYYVKSKDMPNKFDIYKQYSNGKKYKIGLAEITPAGDISIEKTLESTSGSKMQYVYIESNDGNRLINTKLLDSNGNVKYENKHKFKKIDDNHYISTDNGKTYDITYEENKIIVKDDNGTISELPIVENGKNGISKDIIESVKLLPGSILADIQRYGLRKIAIGKSVNAHYDTKKNEIVISKEYAKHNDLNFTLLHELGHYKDRALGICHDKNLLDIYNRERKTFLGNNSKNEFDEMQYFIVNNDKKNITKNPVEEMIAEVNALLYANNTSPDIETRSAFLQEHFPETFKLIAEKITTAQTKPKELNAEENVSIQNIKPETESPVTEKDITAAYREYAKSPYINDYLRKDAPLSEKSQELVRALKYAIANNEVSGIFVRGLTPTKENPLQTVDDVAKFIFGNKGFTSAVPEDRAEFANVFTGKDGVKVIFDIKEKMPGYNADHYEVLFDTNAFTPDKFDIIKEGENTYRVVQKETQNSTTAAKANYEKPKIKRNISEQEKTLITKKTNDIREKFLEEEDNLTGAVREAGLNDGTFFSHRVKSESSLNDKMENYLKDNLSAKAENADVGVLDAYGARSVVPIKNWTKHPEVQKLIKAGDVTGAIKKAAELRAQPYVDRIKQIIIDSAKDSSKLNPTRLSNYMSKEGIPYISEAQLRDIAETAKNNGYELDLVVRAADNDPYYDKMIEDGKTPTTRSQPSGYPAFQMNLTDKNGKSIEWQFRGELVNIFAEAEHLPYDFRTGKNISGGNPELEELFKPIETLLSDKSFKDGGYKDLNKYFNEYYKFLFAKELGFELEEPKLEDFGKFDKRLNAKNLIALHEIADNLKNKKLTLDEAKQTYQNIVDEKVDYEPFKLQDRSKIEDNRKLLEGGFFAEELEEVAPFAKRVKDTPTVDDLTFRDKSKTTLYGGEYNENGEFIKDGSMTITERNPLGKSNDYIMYPGLYDQEIFAKERIAKNFDDITNQLKHLSIKDKDIIKSHFKDFKYLMERNPKIKISDISEVLIHLRWLNRPDLIPGYLSEKEFFTFKENLDTFDRLVQEYRADGSEYGERKFGEKLQETPIHILQKGLIKTDQKVFKQNLDFFKTLDLDIQKGYTKYNYDIMFEKHNEDYFEQVKLASDFNKFIKEHYSNTPEVLISGDTGIRPGKFDNERFTNFKNNVELIKELIGDNQVLSQNIVSYIIHNGSSYGPKLYQAIKENIPPEKITPKIFEFIHRNSTNSYKYKPEDVQKNYMEIFKYLPKEHIEALTSAQDSGLSYYDRDRLNNITNAIEMVTPEKRENFALRAQLAEKLPNRWPSAKDERSVSLNSLEELFCSTIDEPAKALEFLNTVEPEIRELWNNDRVAFVGNNFDKMLKNAEISKGLPKEFKKYYIENLHVNTDGTRYVYEQLESSELQKRVELINKFNGKLDNEVLSHIYIHGTEANERFLSVFEGVKGEYAVQYLDGNLFNLFNKQIDEYNNMTDEQLSRVATALKHTKGYDKYDISNSLCDEKVIQYFKELTTEEFEAMPEDYAFVIRKINIYDPIETIKKNLARIPDRLKPYLKISGNKEVYLSSNISYGGDNIIAKFEELTSMSDAELKNIGAAAIAKYLTDYSSKKLNKSNMYQWQKIPHEVKDKLGSEALRILQQEEYFDIEELQSRSEDLSKLDALKDMDQDACRRALTCSEDNYKLIKKVFEDRNFDKSNTNRVIYALQNVKPREYLFIRQLIDNPNFDNNNISTLANTVSVADSKAEISPIVIESAKYMLKKPEMKFQDVIPILQAIQNNDSPEIVQMQFDYAKRLIDNGKIDNSEINKILYNVESNNKEILQAKFALAEKMIEKGIKTDCLRENIFSAFFNSEPQQPLEVINTLDKIITEYKFPTESKETVERILDLTDGNLYKLVEKILFDKDSRFKDDPELALTLIRDIHNNIAYTNSNEEYQTNYINFIEKLCFDKKFNLKPEHISEIIKNLNAQNIDIAEELILNKEISKTILPIILEKTNGFNKNLAIRICTDKNLEIPTEQIPTILGYTNRNNIKLAEKLCTDKSLNIPKNEISNILQYTNKNTELVENLVNDKDIPKQYITTFAKYTTENRNNEIEKVQKITETPELKKWTIKNIDNGINLSTIHALLATQKKLYNEKINTKVKTKTPIEIQEARGEKVQEAKPADVQRAIDALSSIGINPNMAEKAYVKLCQDKQGNVDKVKLDAMCALVKAFGMDRIEQQNGKVRINPHVTPKDISDIFDLATGSPLSSANGQFRPDIIKDIVTLAQSGMTDVKLASNLASIKNMNLIEMKDRFNTKIRKDLVERVNDIPVDVRLKIKSSGFDIKSIIDKALTEPKGGKVKQTNLETVTLRPLDSIVGTERIILNKYKQELPQEIWGNEERFKAWAEEKLKTEIYNPETDEINPKFAIKGQFEHFGKARMDGIRSWYNYLTKESNYKDDVFVHLLVMDGITKEMRPNNAYVPPAVSHESFEATYNTLLQDNTNISFSQIYAQQTREKAIRQFSKGIQTVDGIEGQWVTIPRSQKGEPDYDEHIAMVQALAEGSSWCLRYDNAHGYLQGGNLHFFVDKNGNSQVAINETDGKITQIQKRYNQNSTVPVPYAVVVSEFAKGNKYQGYEDKIATALNAKPAFDEKRTKYAQLMEAGDYLGLFKELEITVTKAEDGTYILSEYTPRINKLYSLFDLGIDENKLMENVSEIKSSVNLEGSGLTVLQNLRRVTGQLDFGDSKISDIRNLEEINGKKVYWDKKADDTLPEAPNPPELTK